MVECGICANTRRQTSMLGCPVCKQTVCKWCVGFMVKGMLTRCPFCTNYMPAPHFFGNWVRQRDRVALFYNLANQREQFFIQTSSSVDVQMHAQMKHIRSLQRSLSRSFSVFRWVQLMRNVAACRQFSDSHPPSELYDLTHLIQRAKTSSENMLLLTLKSEEHDRFRFSYERMEWLAGRLCLEKFQHTLLAHARKRVRIALCLYQRLY